MIKHKINRIRYFSKDSMVILIALLLLSLSGLSLAAPGTIHNAPLFLSNPQQANIAVLMDDSGSMNASGILRTGTVSPTSSLYDIYDGIYVYNYGDVNYHQMFDMYSDVFHSTGYTLPTDFAYYYHGSGLGVVDWYGFPIMDSPLWRLVFRRMMCSGVNTLAYDPTVTYTPWLGKNDESTPVTFSDRSLTTACDDPYISSTCNVDISSHRYWVWNDANGDGNYDGPASTDLASTDTDGDECGDVSDWENGVAVSGLDSAGRTNYANWYSYYRNREHVAKRALSQMIDDSTSRIGLGGINGISDSNCGTATNCPTYVTTEISDMTNASNKSTLLKNLVNSASEGSTPLRSALKNAGEYYSGNFGSLSSPIVHKCQQSYTLAVTDGYWNGASPALGSANADSDCDDPSGDGIQYDCRSYADTTTDDGDSATISENTLADVAMYYYERDLKTGTGFENEQISNDALDDTNPAQHMNTFTLAFGVNGTLIGDPPNRADAFNWPEVEAGTKTTIDDLRHAAWNGRGKFLSAEDPEGVISAINAAFSNIESRGSSAAVAFNSNTLTGVSAIYLALYDSTDWSGEIVAYPLDSGTGDVGETELWSASDELLTMVSSSSDTRKIFTYKRTSDHDGDSKGIPFLWNDVKDTTIGDDLKTNADASTDTDPFSTSQARLGYLRGQSANAGGGGLQFSCSQQSLG